MDPLLKVIQLYKNEAQLIKKAVRNDRDAQRILYEIHAPKMLSVCRYYINDKQHAEDTMLNGFFKVFSHLKDYEGKGSFEGWIRRIMVREAITFLRQKKHVEFSTDDIKSYDHEDPVYSEIDADDIQSLIDRLPEGYRMVFVMYAIEGYKHSEIATMLNITEGSSKSQLFKARKTLQENIKQLNKASYGAS